ncbi:NYN domain-containing protein [Mycena kentingensis (nom. inval.)]|nr:NYN domain-containing protein [Mycena kentingensis (nom. inval.)]
MQGPVAIFWDYENCHASFNISGYQVVAGIRNLAEKLGRITSFRAYWEIPDSTPRGLALRSELQSSGVSVIDCPHNGRKDVADQMVIVDMLAFVMDNPNATFILISGDRDFAYAVSTLRLRKYEVVVVSIAAHTSLKNQASVWLDWNIHVLGHLPASPSTSSDTQSSLTSSPTTSPFAAPQVPTPSNQDRGYADGVSPSSAHEPTNFSMPAAAPAYTTNPSETEALLTPVHEEPRTAGLDVEPTASLLPHSPPIRPLSTPITLHRVQPAPFEFARPSSELSAQSVKAPFFSIREFVPSAARPVFGGSPPVLAPVASTSTMTAAAPPVIPASRFVPEIFAPLVKGLEAQKALGITQVRRAIIGQELSNGSAYRRAGVQSFSEYAALAAKHGLIKMGGSDGLAWVELTDSTATSSAVPRGPALPMRLAKPVPAIYKPIVDVLMKHRARGVSKTPRSVVESQIAGGASVWSAAGANSFGTYCGRAEGSKVIQMGGSGADAWITLHISMLP